MPEEENEAIVAKFYEEIWNNNNLEIIDKLTLDHYVVHLTQVDLAGREEFKLVVKNYLGSFSHIHLSIGNQTSQDSQVVTFLEWDTALELRDQSCDEEIERKIPVRGVSIDRIDNGRIAESSYSVAPLESLYTIQALSRDPGLVEYLPVYRNCPPACPGGQPCRGNHCSN